jgi:hypothetical protein
LARSKGKESYDQLLLGPLLQHPMIIREFQPPPQLNIIHKVTTLECVKALVNSKTSLRGARVAPSNIVERLASDRGIPALELCVKIGNIGQFCKFLYSREVELEDTLTTVKTHLDLWGGQTKTDDYILDSADQALADQLGRSIAGETAERDVGRLFLDFLIRNMSCLREPCLPLQRIKADVIVLTSFLQEKPLGRGLAHGLLSVLMQQSEPVAEEGRQAEAHTMQMQEAVRQASPARISPAPDVCASATQPPEYAACREPPPSRATVADAIARQLRRRCCVMASAADLVSVQRETSQELGVRCFHDLDVGDFLQFVLEEPHLARLLNGWLGLGAGSGCNLEEVAAHARRALRGLPAGTIGAEDEAVTAAVRLHLRLVHGGPATWQDRAVHAWEAAVDAEGSTCNDDEAPLPSGPSHVLPCAALLAGCMGLAGGSLLDHATTASSALRLLQSAPLLSDLCRWMHWDAAFEAQLGGLRQFLAAHKEAGLTCFDAGPGGLLRVSPVATPATFQAALAQGDAAGAAAELVSVVCLHDGVLRSPLALLAHSAAAGFGQFALALGTDGAAAAEVAVAALAAATIVAVPEGLRAAMVERTIIGPLGAALAVGRARCCTLMWDACHSLPDQRSALEGLGIRLSISEWTTEWAARLLPPNASSPLPPVPEHAMDIGPLEDCREDCASLELDELPAASLQVVQATSQAGPATSQADPHLIVSDGGRSGTAQEALDGALLEVVEARRVVDDIRMTEFGVGLALDANGAGLREALNARVGRALQRLSAELYASDGHFLLELVQNAEDNAYPAGAVPELMLVRGAESILVANNEKGFAEADVRALCDVGRSTKARQAGYIGQKGIGFKSVFRVTEAPQIHSNGFSVAFDTARNGELGYILPEWIGAEALVRALQEVGASADSEPLLDPSSWATVIVLPLREAARGGIETMLDSLSPTLLLFLKKLRRLTVIDVPRGYRRVFERRELERGVVEVSADGEAARYLTATRSIKPAVPRLDVVVESTDVVVAISLPSPGPAGPAGPCPQEVFAFLPVRSYGFRFVLQADFVLPSSRESIDRDSAWNQRLRAEVPAAFALAVEQSLRSDPADPCAAANLWLSALPLEGEVQDFFQPCVRAVHASMRTVACIPTVENKWETPLRVLTCGAASAAAAALIDPAQLSYVLGMSLAHPGLLPRPLAALGVQEFSSGILLELLRAGAYSPDRLPAVIAYLAEDFAAGKLSDDTHA